MKKLLSALFLTFSFSFFTYSQEYIILTIWGNGVASYSGDGGAAISAELNNPFGVSVDALGNIYIADRYNNRIRKLSRIITGTNEIKNSDSQLNIFPNPSTGKFTINMVKASCMASLKVYNIMGQKIFGETLKPVRPIHPGGQVQGDNLIDLSSQSNGVYFYRVVTENGVMLGEGKLVVEK